MKQMCLLFCLALLTAAGAKEEVFRVSKVGSDKTKLLDVFEKVKLLEGGDASFTRAKFIEDLKDGGVWTLRHYETQKCFYCFGKGHLGPLRDNKKCAPCGGGGSETVDLVVKW